MPPGITRLADGEDLYETLHRLNLLYSNEPGALGVLSISICLVCMIVFAWPNVQINHSIKNGWPGTSCCGAVIDQDHIGVVECQGQIKFTRPGQYTLWNWWAPFSCFANLVWVVAAGSSGRGLPAIWSRSR